MINTIRKTVNLIGKKIALVYILSILIGIFHFFVEIGFLYVLQSFLHAIGIIEKESLSIPSFFPLELESALALLLFYSMLRSIVQFSRVFILDYTQDTFAEITRSKISSWAIRNAINTSTDRVMSIITDDVTRASQALSSLTALFIAFSSAIFFFVMGVNISFKLMLFGLCGLGVLFFPLKLIDKVYKNSGKHLGLEWRNLNNKIHYGLKHYFFIVIYNIIEKNIEATTKALKNYRKHLLKYHFLASVSQNATNLLGTIVIASLTLVAIKNQLLSKMELLTFFYIFLRLTQQVSDFVSAFSRLRVFSPGIISLINWNAEKDLIDQKAKIYSFEEKLNYDHVLHVETISCNNVSFSYPSSQKEVLNNINFDLTKGDILYIKGKSGSGKSTLLSLLMGLRKPTKGQIRVNNHALEVIISKLTPEIAYVGPEPFLIEGTIRENLLYGLHNDVSNNDLKFALERAKLWETVNQFKKALDENINEHAELSTGQMQRLSIARALLRNPTLLFLDEFTSNIDKNTESEIMGILEEIRNNAITVIISHHGPFDKIASHHLTLEEHSCPE